MGRRAFRKWTLYCSFCGKAQHEVFTLIAGPQVFICDGCVADCVNIITQKRIESGCDQPLKVVGRSP